MTAIHGVWYDGASSKPFVAELLSAGASVSVRVGEREVEQFQPLADLEISSRLGGTPRFLRFPSGSAFETDENDAIDRLLAEQRRGRSHLHLLESRWRYIALAFVVVVAVAWLVIRVGIPVAAEAAAARIPAKATEVMDRETLALLDRGGLAPSSLDLATQARLTRRFTELAGRQGVTAHIVFRDAAASFGPNAFALPGGTILFTDQLVRLAQGDEQLMAVLAHELGHLHYRHGMRQLLQMSLLNLAAVVILGDISTVSNLITAIPITLTQVGYSRAFEREADRFAVVTLRSEGIAPERLAEILGRLEAAGRCGQGEAHCSSEEELWESYLSTHPPTAERIAAIRSPSNGTR